MGYVCPICETPQVDAGHLANHIAFTAMLHDDEHAVWLDDHVPGWGSMGEADLAGALADELETTDLSDLFDDAAVEDPTDPVDERSGRLFDESPAHTHSHGGHGRSTPVDPEVQAVLEEARAMTRAMRDEDEEENA